MEFENVSPSAVWKQIEKSPKFQSRSPILKFGIDILLCIHIILNRMDCNLKRNSHPQRLFRVFHLVESLVPIHDCT